MAARTTTGLYALVIGINSYPKGSFGDLKGAVKDADSINKWLMDDLVVPEGRIRNLRDTEATRKNIIKELKKLSTNPDVRPGDPILIYYAGHGAEVPPPKRWQWDAPMIQMIVPHDIEQPDGPNRVVHGIPDRTLGFLISNISKAKGDNITVIFDCCHSGSGTRSEGDTRVRGGYLDVPVPEDLDHEVFAEAEGGTRGTSISERFRHSGLRSHVLLAACAQNEKAHEERDSGNFTRILLKALSGVSTTEITYEELILRMDNLTTQTPQCEGFFKTRYLFDKKAPNKRAIYKAQLKGAKLTIEAGAIHGVESGTKFGLWKSRDDIQNLPFAYATVVKVNAYQSVITKFAVVPDTPEALVAQVVGNPPPKLAIYIPKEIEELSCYKGLFNGEKGREPLVINRAKTKELASVGLTYDPKNNKIGFEMLSIDKEQEIRHVIQPTIDELYRAIEHLSSFFHHRERPSKNPTIGPENAKVPFKSKFTLGVYVLVESDDDDGDDDEGERLEPSGENLNRGEEKGIQLVVGKHNEHNDYGFLIENHTDLDVYPYLFYFDSSTFSISLIYQPPETTNSNGVHIPPLKGRSSLPVGYGSSGVVPCGLSISCTKANVERGCFRLYLSTKYVDMKSMEQGDISEFTRGVTQSRREAAGPQIWDCITVPVSMRRGKEVKPKHMIGILGSRGNGKDTFLSEFFLSLNGTPALKPVFDNTYIKEYSITLPGHPPFALVELPAFQDDRIDSHISMLRATMAYLTSEYQAGRRFFGFIWCHNISTNFMGIDSRNINFVQDLCGPEVFKNVVVLTTNWNKGVEMGNNRAAGRRNVAGIAAPLARYEKKEAQLKAHPFCCKALVEGGAVFKRFGVFKDPNVKAQNPATAVIEATKALVESILKNDPQALESQKVACESQILGETGPGKRLGADLKKGIKEKEKEIEDLNLELNKLKRGHPTWAEIEEELKEAKLDILRWTKTLNEIALVGSVLA